jgi:thiol-disulfide isomerase/thioredoxin
LLILLVAIATCAEWSSQTLPVANRANPWWLMSAAAWALAIWVSAYEPPVLFLMLTATTIVMNRHAVFARDRRPGWILFAAIIVVAFLVEQRIPSFDIIRRHDHFKEWARTIGELVHVSPINPVWLHWCGYCLVITPILIWMSFKTRGDGTPNGRVLPIYVVLVATYFLTVWQARWAYFFVLIFAIALPGLLGPIKSRAAVWIAVVLSMFPILRDWDERLWPNETQLAGRVERRIESVQIRDLALDLRSPEVRPFIAPWWLSPSIAYWSGQPGVAGSSHESLQGIEQSARFFLSENLQEEREILEKCHVAWVFAYDSDRVAQNSAAILNLKALVPQQPLCRVLYRTPSQAPPFLIFSAQNSTCKLYRVAVE